MTCAYCRAPTTRPRYCSRACCGAAKRKPCVCAVCGVTFRRPVPHGHARVCCGPVCHRQFKVAQGRARYATHPQGQQRTAAIVAALALPEPLMTMEVAP